MWNWISELDRMRQESRPAVLVTVIRVSGSTPRGPGAKMIVLPVGKITGTIGGGQIEHLAIKDALDCLRQRTTGVFDYTLSVQTGQCCGGGMELMMEPMNTGPQLYLYGAGHVGQALARTLDDTAFTVHVIDPREEWVHSERLPDSVIRHCADWQEFNQTALWDKDRIYAAVMTPSHDTDREIAGDLLTRPLRYLGLIGSRSKWTQFQKALKEQGFGDDELSRVHCPIGVKNTGKAPQEVAVSVAAEVLGEYYATESGPVKK